MLGVNFRLSLRPCGHVWLLVIAFARDPMVLDAGIDASTIRMNVRPDVLEIQVVGNIAVELAVVVIPRIAVGGAPYLPGRIGVPPERRDAGRTINRRVDAITWAFVRAGDAVRLQDSEPDSFFVEKSVKAREVSALRQPETFGLLPKSLPVVLYAYPDLCAHGRFVHR